MGTVGHIHMRVLSYPVGQYSRPHTYAGIIRMGTVGHIHMRWHLVCVKSRLSGWVQ
jgi:hypothetical protein